MISRDNISPRTTARVCSFCNPQAYYGEGRQSSLFSRQVRWGSLCLPSSVCIEPHSLTEHTQRQACSFLPVRTVLTLWARYGIGQGCVPRCMAGCTNHSLTVPSRGAAFLFCFVFSCKVLAGYESQATSGCLQGRSQIFTEPPAGFLAVRKDSLWQ